MRYHLTVTCEDSRVIQSDSWGVLTTRRDLNGYADAEAMERLAQRLLGAAKQLRLETDQAT